MCIRDSHTEAECIVKHVTNHNHAPDVASMKAAKVVQHIKEKDSSYQLLVQASVGISAAGVAKLLQANP